jgi:hypothetical protein
LGRKEIVKYKADRKQKLREIRDQSYRNERDRKNESFKDAIKSDVERNGTEEVQKKFALHLHLA